MGRKSSRRRRLFAPPVRASVQRRRRRAVALLEVVLSISILLVAMSVIGLTFRNGQLNLERSERLTRAMLLTEKLTAELDTGYLDINEQKQSGYFEDEAEPGTSWQVLVEPAQNVEGLLKITIHIFLGDPEGSDKEREHLLTTYAYRPIPMGINFERDFGFSEEQITQLTDAIPGGTGVLDPEDFDPRSLAKLDLDTLVELLPALLQSMGIQLGAGQLDQLMNAARSGDISGLDNLGKSLGGAMQGADGGSGAAGQSAGGLPSGGGMMGPGGQQGGGRPPRNGAGGRQGGQQGGGQPPRNGAGGRFGGNANNGNNNGNGAAGGGRGGGRVGGRSGGAGQGGPGASTSLKPNTSNGTEEENKRSGRGGRP